MTDEAMRKTEATARAAEINAFITHRGDDNDAFDAIARRLFAYQYKFNGPYRTYCGGLGVTPGTIDDWRGIPAVPAAAFKTVALTCAPETLCDPNQDGAIFHSSGTTRGDTSRHFVDAAAANLYRTSLQTGFERFVIPDVSLRRTAYLPVYALMPPPEAAPHSSLSFMLGDLIDKYGGAFFYEADNWQERLADTLQGLSGPVTLFGTAFAWVHLFDWMDAKKHPAFDLPPGSRVVETGGFKGRSREVSRDELYGLFTQRLGVPPAFCLSEYGMSEMASQFYDSNLADHVKGDARAVRKIGPSWLRTRVIDPVTGDDAARGESGLLVHYDLANLNSVFAIQTEDWGYLHPDGDGFVLQGRAPGAVLRGCSLVAEEMVVQQSRQES